jgi:hypothetical protein
MTGEELPKRHRRGPKPRPAEELRLHSVSCRLTDAELALLDERRGQVSRGEWLRRAALSRPPRVVPTVNTEAWAELARVGSNINQMTRALNEGRWTTADVDSTRTALSQLWKKLQKVRDQLIGQGEGEP